MSRGLARRPAVVPGLALACALTGASLASAAAPRFVLPEPQVRRLENGLTVAVYRDARLPLVDLQLAVPAGIATESPDGRGAASMVAELVGRATISRDPEALQADLDRAGSTISTQVGRDFALAGLTCLARELPAGMSLLGEATMEPLFGTTAFESARRARRERSARPLHPSRQGEEALWSAVFGNASYGHSGVVAPTTLDSLTLDDVRTFHRTRWSPAHAVLAVVGDVDPDRAFAAAAEAFGTGPAEDRAAPPPSVAAPSPVRSARIVDRSDAAMSEVYVGLPGPRVGDPDEVAMALAAQLAQRRRTGLRNFRVGQVALKNGGLVWLGATAPHDSVGHVVRALEAVLMGLRNDPPPEGTLDSLRRDVRSAFALRFDTLDGVASQWCAQAVLGLGHADLVAFPARVDSVTAPRLHAAAKRWIDASKLTIVAVGPAGLLKPQLQGLAPIAGAQATAVKPGAPTRAEEKRGRDLVARAVAAHGGLPKLKKIRDSVMEAGVTVRLAGQDMDGHVEITRKEPDRMVYVSRFQDIGTRQVLVGDHAWSAPLDSLSATRDADANAVASMKLGFRSDVPHLLIDASDPKVKLAARGPGEVDGRPVENVELWTTDGDRKTLSFDARTLLLAGMEQREPGPSGADVVMRRSYRDFRDVAGVQLPYEEQRWLGRERVMALKFTRVALNVGISDALFQKPEAALPPPSR